MSSATPIFVPMFGPNATLPQGSASSTQFDMFAPAEPVLTAESVPVPDVLWSPEFLSAEEQAALFVSCRDQITWEYRNINIGGRSVPVPRGLAWFGDVPYTYSGLKHEPVAMPAKLRALADRIEAALAEAGVQAKFNSVLMNYYRNGRDSIGMHSDDERELGRQPIIGSVSLGAPRKFRFQHKRMDAKHEILLPGGSLLIMKGKTQDDWRHGIDKEPWTGQKPNTQAEQESAARINLTFRMTYAR